MREGTSASQACGSISLSFQADGLQAGRRCIKNLAAAQRHKSVAEGHRRCQIQRRHRGHPNAGKPRRLIASSPARIAPSAVPGVP